MFFLFKKFGTTRNISVFWEPGLYSTVLIYCIIFEICSFKRNNLRILIFILGILSSKSTFGIVCLILVIVFFLSKKMDIKGYNILYGIFLIMLFFLYIKFNEIVKFLAGYYPIVFEKIINNSDSITDRLASPINNMKVFMNAPFLGNGIKTAEDLYLTISYIPQLSTVTYYFAIFGIFGGVYIFFILKSIFSLEDCNKNMKMILFTIIFFIVNKEPHLYITITYIILFYLEKRKKILWEPKRK